MGEVKFKLRPVEEKPKRGSKKESVMWIVFNTKKNGFETVIRDYVVMALRFLWGSGKGGANSRAIWLQVNKILMEEEGRSVSRATIINAMNDMVDAGVLKYTERTGKGGYHRVYSPALDEEGFKLHVAKTVISKLSDTWPDANRESLANID